MDALKIIYAHNNPFISASLQDWQAMNYTYMSGDEYQQYATAELKTLLTKQVLVLETSKRPRLTSMTE